ncbi:MULTISPECIES: DUF4259 domain-containing protein [unclassified Pseudomonas]|uniref:DUF4259 domain-containing protein n=1 Tax=unclassified Pseudomonas TaxID=196821 RepID=UPI002449077A|nr:MULTISPECIES: DUF4259 domain-containing protein [unclassified Pseudomonas]MDH0895720.1 DUF4259 domain-containing protein [Pseudomonas sp. GD03875]MDH1066632.1 DUF4259 domain-containing protein [Pseudomonas sp. GD03985]
MGTWSTDILGNDMACNWLSQLSDYEDFSLVEQTLDGVLAIGDDYLESDQAEAALAAAEVVAHAAGNPQPGIGGIRDMIDDWLEDDCTADFDSALLGKSLRAIDRILQEPSETLEGWGSDDDRKAWIASINDLKSRVMACL